VVSAYTEPFDDTCSVAAETFQTSFFLIQAPKFVFSVALRLLISIQVRQASCDVCAPWIIDVVLVS
jgi:hypothetical protein